MGKIVITDETEPPKQVLVRPPPRIVSLEGQKSYVIIEGPQRPLWQSCDLPSEARC